MTSQDDIPNTIPEYIEAFPQQTQERLREMLGCLRKAAPGAIENLKWRQPALSYKWILFQFAAFEKHISLYPTPAVVKAFEKELVPYQTSSSTIQFPLDQSLPVTLIRKIADYRVQEAEKGVKWM
ncbi:MAG TPA: DUF1801 domain-containing protein [Bellilinea sp.]|nr:DUF1801 domain-containing protein [Bellilinea sp.]